MRTDDIYKKSEEALDWADEKVDNVLGNDHNLSEKEVSVCRRILTSLKDAMDVCDRDREKGNLYSPGGYAVRMAKDIIFLMACLAERSEEENKEEEK